MLIKPNFCTDSFGDRKPTSIRLLKNDIKNITHWNDGSQKNAKNGRLKDVSTFVNLQVSALVVPVVLFVLYKNHFHVISTGHVSQCNIKYCTKDPDVDRLNISWVNINYWWRVRVTIVVAFGFFSQNCWEVVRIYESFLCHSMNAGLVLGHWNRTIC